VRERERKGTTGKGRERLLTGLTELCWHSYTVRVHSPSYFHLSRLQVRSRQVVRLSLFFGLFWLVSIERGVDSCFGPGIDPLLLRTYIGSQAGRPHRTNELFFFFFFLRLGFVSLQAPSHPPQIGLAACLPAATSTFNSGAANCYYYSWCFCH